MSKLNINKSEWLELVFEGKNKAYGAYQLRQEEGRTTMKAFFGAMLLLTGIVGLGLVMSSFDKKPIEHKPYGPVIVCKLLPPAKEEVKKVEPITKKGKALKEEVTTDLTANIKVVKKEEAPKTPITENSQLGLNKDPNAQPDGDGGDPKGVATTIVTNTPEVQVIDPKVIMDPMAVDKMPSFPGNFSKEIAKKFVAPEMDEQKTLRVFVLFVVEKDGTISNIRVANDPGFGMGAEAIRVLKAIKTKWEPGMFKGQAVRTSFSVPIVVKTAVQD